MKPQKLFLSVLFAVFLISGIDAQIFKRLKERTKQKLERKAEEAIEKEIDSFSFKNKKEEKQKTEKGVGDNAQNSIKTTAGSAVIKHGRKYGNYLIEEFGKAKLERTNEGIKIFGSWVTHAADIHDGYVLEIPNGNNQLFIDDQPTQKQITLKIPEEAMLKLSYDPVWEAEKSDENGFSRAVTKEYQSYNIESGEVIIDVVSEDNIQFSFSGKTQLETRIKNSNNSDNEYVSTYITSSLSGAVDVGPIQFFDNRIKKESEERVQEMNSPTISSSTSVPGVYDFTFETEVIITNLDDNETYKMSYLLNPSASYFGIKADMGSYSDEEVEGESLIVMDGDDVHIFVETQGMKMRMSQGIMGGEQMKNPAKEMAAYDYTNLTKTGKTKTILDAECHEYKMQDNQVKIELWVAPSVNLPNWFVQNKEVLEGHIMEYTLTTKDGKMKSQTIAINDHIRKTINPKDYRKMF